MSYSVNLQPTNPTINSPRIHTLAGVSNPHRFSYDLRLPSRPLWPFKTLAVNSESSAPPRFTATVGAPSLPPSSLQFSPWHFGQRNVVLLNVVACSVAVSMTLLFCSAIPMLLAFKRAAESLEKLMDVMREELPGTMAALRLSGMEISDLTTELSDLGQEITQGVRKSTQAVRVAEERLRRMTNMAPSVSLQRMTNLSTETPKPLIARTARGVREGIVKGRAIFGMLLSLVQFSRWALNFLAGRRKRVG